MRTMAMCLAALVAACSGGSTSSGGGTTRAPVTGTRFNTSWQDDGTALVRPAHDLDAVAVSALVREGAGWREAPGTFAADGSFSIPDVGPGDYLLRVTVPGTAPRYVPESVSVVELGGELVGRPNRQVALLSSPITFALTGLEPWSTGGSVTLFSTGAGLLASLWAPVPPPAGATSADLTLDFRGRALPVVGDLGWMLQNVQRTAGPASTPYTVVARASTLIPLVNMSDGDTATIDVPVAVPATSGTVALDLRLSQLTAAALAMAPAATTTLSNTSVAVRAYPRTLAASYATLLSVPATGATTDVDLGTLSYPRPFPSWFTEVRSIETVVQAQIPGALGSSGVTLTLVASRVEPLPGAANPVVPTLGPARLPFIAGRDALQPQGGVGLTPTLSWSAPLVGAPTRYSVGINEILNGVVTTRATLGTTGTSVTIPPRVMVPGGVYFAVISAYAEPGFDFAAPYRQTAPREIFPSVTAPFAP